MIDVIGGFFSGYGWKNVGDSIMMLDLDMHHTCGDQNIANIAQRLSIMHDTNMVTPCYTAPKNSYFTRMKYDLES